MNKFKRQDYFHTINIILGIVFIASGLKGVYVKNIVNIFFVSLGIIIIIYNACLIYKSRK